MMSLKPQEHLRKAISDISNEVKVILGDISLSLTEKDSKIFPYLQQKRVLEQCIEDLDYLEKREVPESSSCKMSSFR
jgi:hypothetical protein